MDDLDILNTGRIEEVILKRARVRSEVSMTPEALDAMKVEARPSYLNTIVVRLTQEMIAVGEQEHGYPIDWWQAFRQRWLPGWWLRRWPVIFATFRTWEKVCPHHALPQHADPHLQFFTMDD